MLAVRQRGLPRDKEEALIAALRQEEQAALGALKQEERLRREAERKVRLCQAYTEAAGQATHRPASRPRRPRERRRIRLPRPRR